MLTNVLLDTHHGVTKYDRVTTGTPLHRDHPHRLVPLLPHLLLRRHPPRPRLPHGLRNLGATASRRPPHPQTPTKMNQYPFLTKRRASGFLSLTSQVHRMAGSSFHKKMPDSSGRSRYSDGAELEEPGNRCPLYFALTVALPGDRKQCHCSHFERNRSKTGGMATVSRSGLSPCGRCQSLSNDPSTGPISRAAFDTTGQSGSMQSLCKYKTNSGKFM